MKVVFVISLFLISFLLKAQDIKSIHLLNYNSDKLLLELSSKLEGFAKKGINTIGSPAVNDFEIVGVLSSEKYCYENWGYGYSPSGNYGFFTKLKLMAGKECARVPVNVVIDANNNKCLTVGANTIISGEVKIFPNPSNSASTVSNAFGELNIFDVKGAKIARYELTGNSKTFGNTLENGIYFIQINSNENSITHKIIKK